MTMLNICKLTILDALSVKQAYSKCPFWTAGQQHRPSLDSRLTAPMLYKPKKAWHTGPWHTCAPVKAPDGEVGAMECVRDLLKAHCPARGHARCKVPGWLQCAHVARCSWCKQDSVLNPSLQGAACCKVLMT